LAAGVVVVNVVANPKHLMRGDARRTGEGRRERVDAGRAEDPELFVLRKSIVDRNIDRSGDDGKSRIQPSTTSRSSATGIDDDAADAGTTTDPS
jgi:hypothetical protein